MTDDDLSEEAKAFIETAEILAEPYQEKIAALRGEIEALTASLHAKDDRTPSAKRSADYWLRMLRECEAERDQLRGEVERLRGAIRRRDERITDEKLASFVARANGNSWSRPWRIVGYLARCVQDERDSARTHVAAAQAQLAGARDYIDEYDEHLAAAEARLEAVRAAMNHPDVRCLCGHESSRHAVNGKRRCTETADRASWHCPCRKFDPVSIPTRLLDASLSAAPQPEPDDDGEDDASPFPCWDLGHAPCRFDKRPINASFHPDIEEEPLVMVDVDDAPPASDEPARCEPHALTEYGTTNCPVEGVRANVDDGECSACGAKVGPAASDTPDGQR